MTGKRGLGTMVRNERAGEEGWARTLKPRRGADETGE